nr:tRNA (adenosine(37)-N6)-threonylcarbamoyltransferase complex ATPase subunit type 1 TsaE [Aphanothece hegewaldii]
MNFILSDADSTQNLGLKLGELLPAGSVILLTGELGAGKTTFVQGLGLGLGIKDAIVSPTFTLVSEYLEGRLPLYHLDLYRLETTEVNQLYLESYWEGIDVPLGITAIEWAQRLPDKPHQYIDIHLSYLPEKGRQATLKLVGNLLINLELLL